MIPPCPGFVGLGFGALSQVNSCQPLSDRYFDVKTLYTVHSMQKLQALVAGVAVGLSVADSWSGVS